jgi:putative ABC transport system substrate-binding protein
MRRRDLLLLLAGAMTGPRTLCAQEKAIPVIGFLNASKPVPAFLDEFRNGLAENGYHEGQNVVIEYRWPKASMTAWLPWRRNWFAVG